jgi:hypothetical protein
MAIVFPINPSVNDTFTVGSITYKWDSTKWIGLGVTPIDRLIEGSNKLEIDGSNNLVWTGFSAQFDGANSPAGLDTRISQYGSLLVATTDDIITSARCSIDSGNGNIATEGAVAASSVNLQSAATSSWFQTGTSLNSVGYVWAAKDSSANVWHSGLQTDGDLYLGGNLTSANNIGLKGSDGSGFFLGSLSVGDQLTLNNPTYNSAALLQTDAKDNTSYAPPAPYPANQIELQNSVSMGSAIMRFRSQSSNASAGIWNVGAVPRTNSLKSDFVFQSRTADSTYSEIARFSGDGGLKFVGQSAAVRGTMTSETFSAYEEGTYTPNWVSCTSCVYDGGTSASYTRIGRIVIVSGIIMFTTYGVFSNGWDQITLPFIGSDSPSGGANGVGYWAVSAGGTGRATNTLNFGPLDGPGASSSACFTNIFQTSDNGMSNANLNTIFTSSSTVKQVRFNITYHTDAV